MLPDVKKGRDAKDEKAPLVGADRESTHEAADDDNPSHEAGSEDIRQREAGGKEDEQQQKGKQSYGSNKYDKGPEAKLSLILGHLQKYISELLKKYPPKEEYKTPKAFLY